MKKRLNKFFKFIFILAFVLTSNILYPTSGVNAAGDLIIDWGIPDPFNVQNMLPGDETFKDISITNSGTIPRVIAIKGELVEEEKNFPDILDIEITRGVAFVYGGPADPKKLRDFLNESSGPNGIVVATLDPDETGIFRVKVKFPASAGNEYQNALVIFNLLIGIERPENLVINEVFYDVDSEHGFDSPKDRGISDINGNSVDIIIKDNASGSTNIVEVSIFDLCQIVQVNNADIRTAVDIWTDSGGNSASGNTGGIVSIQTGIARSIFNLFNSFGFNFGSCNGKKLGQNHEWVEIFNPTDFDISLKNWKLLDNSGEESVINANKSVPAGGFALVSKDASVWQYWNEDPDATKIEIGGNIGDGLGDDGDHLYLKDPDGNTVDFTAWGNDTEIWNPAVADVAEGHSIERLSPGFDFDHVSDWEDEFPPTPGFD